MNRPTRYAVAVRNAEQALAAVLTEAARTGSDGLPAAESLELLRLWWHRRIDDLVDEEALRHPSPRRIIARAARYAELQAGDRWA